MKIISQIDELRKILKKKKNISFVPTMGNLHEGHIKLVQHAQQQSDVVVASIFVNRLQFGPNEDFDHYPRTFEDDCMKLKTANVDLLFAPEEKELYPEPQTFKVQPCALADTLEGEFRPGFFQGVASIVLKLFNIVQPQLALFGKKDYQQWRIVEGMVRQFNLPIKIMGIETIRAADGLALSSRNNYLSPAEKIAANYMYQVLRKVQDAILKGEKNYKQLEKNAVLDLKETGWKPDYVAVRKQNDLQLPDVRDCELVILAAARLGQTRLIDNLEI